MGVLCTWVKLQICRFWAVNCTKMRLVAGLRPDPLESYSASPGLLAVIIGRKGEKEKKRAGNSMEGEKGEGGERREAVEGVGLWRE